MRKIILLIFASTLIFSCQSKKSKKEQLIKTELKNIIEEVGIPGINLAISMSNDEIWTISEGFSDKEKQILMKPEDVMF